MSKKRQAVVWYETFPGGVSVSANKKDLESFSDIEVIECALSERLFPPTDKPKKIRITVEDA